MREMMNDNSTQNTNNRSFTMIKRILIFIVTLIFVSVMSFFIAILVA